MGKCSNENKYFYALQKQFLRLLSWSQSILKAVNMLTLQTFSIKLPMDCDFPSLFNSMQVLTIMDPLSCDNAIYEDINMVADSGHFFPSYFHPTSNFHPTSISVLLHFHLISILEP